MKPVVQIEQIHVSPGLIDVMDVAGFRTVGMFLRIIPSYYKCEIQLSPYVLQLALKWLLEHEHIHLKGTLTIPIRRVNYGFPKQNEKETNEEENGPSIRSSTKGD